MRIRQKNCCNCSSLITNGAFCPKCNCKVKINVSYHTAPLVLALFAGRHELPAHDYVIYSSFDFERKRAIETPEFGEFVMKATMADFADVRVIVTGLTPALIQFLKTYKNHSSITLLHYDIVSKEYWEQKF